MSYCRRNYFLLWIFITVCSLIKGFNGNHVILINFGGLQWDFLSAKDTPNILRLASTGSTCSYVNGVFPSETLPALQTIVTGRYPKDHGVIANNFYDQQQRKQINLLDFKNGLVMYNKQVENSVLFGNPEPIWLTARKNGVQTGSMYWPGTEASITGNAPNATVQFPVNMNFRARVDKIVEWITIGGVGLVLVYVPDVNAIAHVSGIPAKSMSTQDMLQQCDGMLGYLMNQLEENKLLDKTNILLTSDHGLVQMPQPNHLFDVTEIVNATDIIAVASNGILPIPGKEEIVYGLLKQHQGNVTVYHRNDLPQKLHLKDSSGVLPIYVLPEPGWRVVESSSPSVADIRASSGYNPDLQMMKPLFIATGPDVKDNFWIQDLSLTDIYPLLCKLIHIPALPNNGSKTRIQAFLKTQQVRMPNALDIRPATNKALLTLFVVLGVVLCIGIVSWIVYHIRKNVQYSPITEDESYMALLRKG